MGVGQQRAINGCILILSVLLALSVILQMLSISSSDYIQLLVPIDLYYHYCHFGFVQKKLWLYIFSLCECVCVFGRACTFVFTVKILQWPLKSHQTSHYHAAKERSLENYLQYLRQQCVITISRVYPLNGKQKSHYNSEITTPNMYDRFHLVLCGTGSWTELCSLHLKSVHFHMLNGLYHIFTHINITELNNSYTGEVEQQY